MTPALVYNLEKEGQEEAEKGGEQSIDRRETIINDAVLFVRSAGGMAKAKELLSKLSLLHE